MGSAATFRAMRETLGLHRNTVAEIFKVNPNTVKKWETPGTDYIPAHAWELIETLYASLIDVVEQGLLQSEIEDVETDHDYKILYYANADDFAKDHPGEDIAPESWRMHNAAARLYAANLAAEGIDYSFYYAHRDN